MFLVNRPNPNAPPELARFAFLIGEWQCDVRAIGPDGNWHRLQATWAGRYILDGSVIADEYRMTTAQGDVVVHGMNVRFYSAKGKTWVMRWLNATHGTWIELGPEALGGVHAGLDTISFHYIDSFAPDVLSRATFSNISDSRFTWIGDQSTDRGKTWTQVVILEARRPGTAR